MSVGGGELVGLGHGGELSDLHAKERDKCVYVTYERGEARERGEGEGQEDMEERGEGRGEREHTTANATIAPIAVRACLLLTKWTKPDIQKRGKEK